MTRPDPSPDIPSDRAALRVFALRLGVQADHLTGRAARWRERTADGGSLDKHDALDGFDGFDKAHTTLTDMAAQLGALPADAGAALDLAGDTPQTMARRVRDALAAMRDPDGLPAPDADLKAAAETVLQVSDVLLSATAPTAPTVPADMSPAAVDRSCRVEVTATRYTLRPPCCPNAPIILARDVTEPLALARLDCLACGLRYDVALLGDPDQGLWVCWREQTRPRP
ncbi:MAG: hypothetical protein ACRD0K_23360 [Egibacteraceae bacterium]